jgi:hypothetical protein
MMRAARQTMDGDGWDWTCRKTRRILKGFARAGVGKSIKRRLSRQRRQQQKQRTSPDA